MGPKARHFFSVFHRFFDTLCRTRVGGWAMSPYENLENPHETLEILGSLGGLGNVKVF